MLITYFFILLFYIIFKGIKKNLVQKQFPRMITNNYHLKAQGFKVEVTIPTDVAGPVCACLFAVTSNMHPVRVAIKLQKYPVILEHASELQKVLESMCMKEMAKGAETDEALAFKFHYIGCFVAEMIKFRQQKNPMKTEKADIMEGLIKKFLKCNKTDGIPEYQETFARESARSFPYKKSKIFHQLMASLETSNPPSALSIILAAIYGKKAFSDNAQVCVTCGEDKANRKCIKCKAVQYCDRECQRLHWFTHKMTCTRLDKNIVASAKISNTDREEISNAVSSKLQNLNVN